MTDAANDVMKASGGSRMIRVKEMEARLNRIKAWVDGHMAQDRDLEEDVRRLSGYYQGPLWRSDFEAEEAGEFPDDLPRGVLSEDGIYNVLTEYEERLSRSQK